MKTTWRTWAGVLGLAVGGAVTAAAEDWSWTVYPYAWAAGLDGEAGAGGLVAPVDKSASDILKDLELAAMAKLDGNNGRWGILADLLYLDLEDSQNTPAGKVKAGVEQWMVSGGAYYRVHTVPDLVLDVGAGARYLDLSLDLSTPLGSRSGSVDWVDPLVLARAVVPVSAKAYLLLSGDVGGFGVESDLAWQVLGAVGYTVNRRVDVLVGYRHFDVDYEKDGVVYDAATSGAALGIGISL